MRFPGIDQVDDTLFVPSAFQIMCATSARNNHRCGRGKINKDGPSKKQVRWNTCQERRTMSI